MSLSNKTALWALLPLSSLEARCLRGRVRVCCKAGLRPGALLRALGASQRAVCLCLCVNGMVFWVLWNESGCYGVIWGFATHACAL